MYFKSTNKKVVEAAVKHQKTYFERRKAIFAFAENHGSDTVFMRGSNLEFLGVYFNGVVPDGWTKPDRHGCSHPKKVNKEANAEIDSFPICPATQMLTSINFPLRGIRCNSFRIGERNFLLCVPVIPVADNTTAIWEIPSKYLHDSTPEYNAPEDAVEIMESEYMALIKEAEGSK